jgi:hypothetical protein
MLFTRIGKVIAHLIFWLSLFNLISATLVAILSPDFDTMSAIVKRYFGSGKIGKYIDRGFYGILIAVVLGILVEISINLNKRTKENERVEDK